MNESMMRYDALIAPLVAELMAVCEREGLSVLISVATSDSATITDCSVSGINRCNAHAMLAWCGSVLIGDQPIPREWQERSFTGQED